MEFSRGFGMSAAEAAPPYYCLIKLIQKVHYTTVLAPLRGFSLQPKGFFRRTRGRIVLSFAPSAAAGWHFDSVKATYGSKAERRSVCFLALYPDRSGCEPKALFV